MTSGIDSSARIASMFRGALAAQQKGKVSAPVGRASPTASKSTANLNALIAGRVAMVAADDPHRKANVFRAFLEATLVAELGEGLLVDPGFANMVDAVQEQMNADPQIAAAVEQAVQLLLTPSSSSG